MNVARLIEELKTFPSHLEVRVAMDLVTHPEDDDSEFPIAQPEEAQTVRAVVFEGNFVGLYA